MATAKSANKKNTLSFEQSLARLDEIIAMLEKDKIASAKYGHDINLEQYLSAHIGG